MGWKTIKETFGISHIVMINEAGLCIGSPYVPNLAVIDLVTGVVRENTTFSGFLKQYPSLQNAKPEQLLDLMSAPDTFSASIPVYTCEGGNILEKYCDVLGYPNVTHDGCLMYENTFSDDKEKIVRRAKEVMTCNIKYDLRNIKELEGKLAACKAQLVLDEADQAKLDQDYPDVLVEVCE